MSDERTREYARVADWHVVQSGKTRKFILVPGRLDYVEDDGAESISEDFSNNVEYFLFEPDSLRKRNPRIYTWIGQSMDDKFVLRKGSTE